MTEDKDKLQIDADLLRLLHNFKNEAKMKAWLKEWWWIGGVILGLVMMIGFVAEAQKMQEERDALMRKIQEYGGVAVVTFDVEYEEDVDDPEMWSESIGTELEVYQRRGDFDSPEPIVVLRAIVTAAAEYARKTGIEPSVAQREIQEAFELSDEAGMTWWVKDAEMDHQCGVCNVPLTQSTYRMTPEKTPICSTCKDALVRGYNN